MNANYPSSLRQRRRIIPATTDDTVEFAGTQHGIDERTILKLFRRPTLANCMYRANEFLAFLVDCLASFGSRLIVVATLPLLLALIVIWALGKSDVLTDATRPSNLKVLQFNFIVVSCCYSLLVFIIAVDYSKVAQLSQSAIELRRIHHNRQKAMSESGDSAGPDDRDDGGATRILHQIVQTQRINGPDVGSDKVPVVEDSTKARDLLSNSAVPASLGQPDGKISSQYLTSWWSTYSILRLNLHCLIFQIKSTVQLILSPSQRKSRRRRSRTHKLNHHMLQPLKGNLAKLSIGIVLVLVAIAIVTGLKHVHYDSTSSPPSNWIIHKFLWTTALAGYLSLHFLTLLSVAAFISNSPSKINFVRLMGRWLLALLACMALKVAILPAMQPRLECSVKHKIDNEIFPIFDDFDAYIDTPIVNSIGISRSKVLFMLGSLVTAVTAAVLYQTTALQWAIGSVGTLLEFFLGVSPIEGMILLLNFFAMETNFLILFMPFLAKMTESELFCIFVIMLIKTPGEGDDYWTYRPDSDSNNIGLGMRTTLQNKNRSTYLPQRLLVRCVLTFPLIILFCRIIYPSGGKIGAPSAQFRHLISLKHNRPFKSLGESLLFFVSYCLRGLCRYFVMTVFLHCIEFLIKFIGKAIDFKVLDTNMINALIRSFLIVPVSILTDLVEFYPDKGQRMSGYIYDKFFNPEKTFQSLFIIGKKLTESRKPDPILDKYHQMSMPIKETVASGSLSLDTIIVFAAFTADFLVKDRKTSIAFVVKGCLAAVLIYSAMQNLMYLACDHNSLMRLHNISADWVHTLKHFNDRLKTVCAESLRTESYPSV